MSRVLDVIVVGGGAAGLSAALMLGRCRFRCLVIDDGRPRNAAASSVHGFLTRDGARPASLLSTAKAEVRGYGIAIRNDRVVRVKRSERGFAVRCRSGFSASSFWIVIATGVLDDVPDLPGFSRMYGTSVHHCPFCDGWEHRDERLAVFAPTGHGIDLCRRLLSWSRRLVLFTHGWRGYRGAALARLSKRGVRIVESPVKGLEGRGKQLERVRLEDANAIPCDALFFSTGVRASCDFAATLGCRVSRKGIVRTDGRARAGPKRVYIVGDASRDSQLLAIAIAEGAKAALAIQAERERLEAR